MSSRVLGAIFAVLLITAVAILLGWKTTAPTDQTRAPEQGVTGTR